MSAVIIPIIILAFAGGIWFQKKQSEKNDSETIKFEDTLNKQIHLSDEEKKDIPLFLSAMNDACSFKVNNYKETELNGEKAYLVSTILTYPDVSDDIRQYLESDTSSSFNEEKVNQDISEIVNKAQMSNAKFDLYFVPQGEDYIPIFTEEVIDKMYGGIYSGYYNELDKLAKRAFGGDSNEENN